MKPFPLRLGQVRTKDTKALAHSDAMRPPTRLSRLTPSASVLGLTALPCLARRLGEEVA